jgi:hypothetical protein
MTVCLVSKTFQTAGEIHAGGRNKMLRPSKAAISGVNNPNARVALKRTSRTPTIRPIVKCLGFGVKYAIPCTNIMHVTVNRSSSKAMPRQPAGNVVKNRCRPLSP